MAAYGLSEVSVTGAVGPARARLALVTEDFWDLTGAQPALGRPALVACCVPALKAADVDPAIALRYD
jgi:hypothetical protein